MAAAAMQRNRARRSIYRLYFILHQLNMLLLIVFVVFAQKSTGFLDIFDQEVRNRHTRVGWFGLVTDQSDVVLRCQAAQCFRSNDTCRTGANNDVLHSSSIKKNTESMNCSPRFLSAKPVCQDKTLADLKGSRH